MYLCNFSYYILFVFILFCVNDNNLITSSPVSLDDLLIDQIKNDNKNNGLNGKFLIT